MTKESEILTLKEAVKQYQQEEKAVANSYDWYRRQAQRNGKASVGGVEVSTTKQNGIWYVDKEELDKAIRHHRESVKRLKLVTEDYRKGIIHGKDGDTIHTEFGGYKIYGDFRFVWDDVQRYRKKSYGTWYCNRCQAPAETEHNKQECHLCSDWNGCGEDCTLSKVYCPECGTSIEI